VNAGRERVLITGGSGFIGANLARTELVAGNAVHLLLRPDANLWRLKDIEGGYIPEWGDLRDVRAVQRAVEASRPDVVYHLATHGAYHSQRDRRVILTTNMIGTANLLDALAGRDYRALVYTGSSSEYGHKRRPMREDDMLEPRTDYGVTKAAATLLCQAEAFRGAPIALVRVFSAYGPWDAPDRLVPYLMRCCHLGEDPQVSAGWQPRDFIYIDDLLDLLRLAAHQQEGHGRILHAGTGCQRHVRDMVEGIIALCGGGRVKPIYGGADVRPDEPRQWVASIDETTTRTGWRPRVDLVTGIRRTWDWFLAWSEPSPAGPTVDRSASAPVVGKEDCRELQVGNEEGWLRAR
jgi:nucleoside-diphosphate-sugar epimerase